jgi:hypothetical protein
MEYKDIYIYTKRIGEFRCSNRKNFLIELQRSEPLLLLSSHVYAFHQYSSTRPVIENIRKCGEIKETGWRGSGKRRRERNVEERKRMRMKKKEVNWTFREFGLEPIRK